MTASEIAMCLGAVLSSSTAQMLMKAASTLGALRRGFPLLTAGIALQLTSVILAILVLRSLQLSQLMPFAALAYVLVPLGGALVFKERLTARFWSGAILIALGIAWALPGAA
ncbi:MULTISPECIES: hypothetical protein [Hydrogenophaga]|uniref:EamA domain-containing protein n=1 Tax=Hydrogenophaga intermedia TaxID=65786 RepID=A0A1L1PL79_HYDIT|nr:MULTISPECIES: hypothetical protein [Hydrogenophaga]AOS81328.1 hypothetical protein Q5W_21435 [Hydrogenophaga sp. PBC]TMU74212.1 hypothetical protein FGJ01_14200 [Hydrogenophaga intermedia]CDN87697.1 hypothetical protein BN948_02122 [Hydrogenophaga intermedia]